MVYFALINVRHNIDKFEFNIFQFCFFDLAADGNWKPDTWQSSGVRPMFIVNKVNGAAARRTQRVITRFNFYPPTFPIQKATRITRIRT